MLNTDGAAPAARATVLSDSRAHAMPAHALQVVPRRGTRSTACLFSPSSPSPSPPLTPCRLLLRPRVQTPPSSCPPARRTVPFVAKAIGHPIVKYASLLMSGKLLSEIGFTEEPTLPHVCVKEVVVPWRKFAGCDPVLGPEMRSTGEVMGIDETFSGAYAKAQVRTRAHAAPCCVHVRARGPTGQEPAHARTCMRGACVRARTRMLGHVLGSALLRGCIGMGGGAALGIWSEHAAVAAVAAASLLLHHLCAPFAAEGHPHGPQRCTVLTPLSTPLCLTQAASAHISLVVSHVRALARRLLRARSCPQTAPSL